MRPSRGNSTQLLVIGAGATGLGIAWDASLRGLKVIVIERGDLGQGTSGRYHGLLHSGARYAVSDPDSARDCALENAILRRIARPCIEDTGGLFVVRPNDPPDYPGEWLAACRSSGVRVEEERPAEVLRREPALAPDIVRAFRVADASLDSFDLLHRLAARVRAAGGQVWLRHEFRALLQSSGRIVGAEAQDLRTGEERRVEAEMVVNAAGPWAGSVASGAGISLPLSLSKGTMVALAARPVQTVVNRCAYPGDGDILVPVGTVVVLGTTDTPVDSAEDLVPVVAEVHELLEAAAHLLPGVEAHRPLRAWSGVRTLYRPPGSSPDETRALPRSHHIVDHAATDGIHGLLTIVGGKLTTYRRMAQDIVDQVASRLGNTRACATDDAVLDDDFGRFFALPSRWEAAESSDLRNDQPGMLCECELVTRASAEHALDEEPPVELDDLRRDLRLGMGPCQAAFCAYRAGDLLARRLPTEAWEAIGIFLQERWRGARILSWGHMLRQLELHQRISLELLETPPPMDSA